MRSQPTTKFRIAAPALAALALSGCMVGPNYSGAPNAAPRETAAGRFHRASSAPVTPVQPPSRWWEALRDPQLTQLIDSALAASPNIRVAEARVRQARGVYRQRTRELLPNGNATAIYARSRIPTGNLPGEVSSAQSSLATLAAPTLAANPQLAAAASSLPDISVPDHIDANLYDTGFDASWEIDLFGGRRRGAQAARAQAEAAEAQLADAQVQLAAEVAQAYVNLRDVQHRLALTSRSAELERKTLGLSQQRKQQGTGTNLDVDRLTAQTEMTESQVSPLRGQVEQALDQLAVLTGREPGALDAALKAPRAIPVPPRRVPVGNPADMIRRRPDIRSAERQLVASNAQIGQAVAQLFPSVNLVGTIGWAATDFDLLGTTKAFSYTAAPVLQWNVLDFGRNMAKIRQAQAANDASIAQYENTVLMALNDAETALSRFGHQRESVVRLANASAAASRAAVLTRQMYQAGTATLSDTLDVEQQRLQAEQSLAQGEAQLTNYYISLQKSLGLGWQQPQPVAKSAT
ncbi:efflux transporter, outer membrane factor (OMF) lipoprotein, NodT family [Faunimonas pinastri]|uniref:Efflux transporter, outer membrane factor (OMF) lipoprotein, NodT family n=1 Tax=Faunimonas pinastri TaxID=1855383 RepID=A0A1H9K8E9_9HYPH|nr:efflux transporter outer membrane subunit [Faunimonas pinastri]SEQ95440.1 efflux transporter, outer membrane factor (OMF) lipoprotein, NodT family [Faunimonas pinastri]